MTPAFDPTSLIIAGIALAVGLLLLFIGFRGRRIGTEPRCRQCGYNLTGAASENCSECGATINQHGIVYGTRRRRPVVIAVAALILPTAGMFGWLDGYSRLRAIDWYPYYPVAWLINQGRAGDDSAIYELDRRLRAGKLSKGQVQTLITNALAVQSRAPGPDRFVTQQWVDLLEYLSQAKQLSDTQQLLYLEQMYSFALVVRPRVRVGERIPYAIRYTTAGPHEDLEPADKARPASYDAHTLRLTRLGEEMSFPAHAFAQRHTFRMTRRGEHAVGGPYDDLSFMEVSSLTPGRYQLSCTLDHLINDYVLCDDVDTNSGGAVLSKTLSLSADLQVIPADFPDTIELVDEPSLTDQIRAALNFDSITCAADQSSQRRPFLQMTWYSGWPSPSAATLPIDVAFDLIVRLESGDWPVHKFLLPAGSRCDYYLTVKVAPADVENVKVILRPNPADARETVDMFKIWGGELILENVPVKRENQ